LVRDTEGLDPEDLKHPAKAGAGRPLGDSDEKVITALRTAECVAGLPGLKAWEIQRVTGIAHRTFYDAMKRLIPGRVAKCAIIKGYQLSIVERQKVSDEEEVHVGAE
jgi:hypothetical protein